MNREQQREIARNFLDGEQIQVKVGDKWLDTTCLSLMQNCKSQEQAQYRVKPVPREIWVNDYGNYLGGIYLEQQDARRCCSGPVKQVKFVEVVEDE